MAYVNIDESYLVKVEIEESQVLIVPFEYEKKDKKTGEVIYKNGEPVTGTMYSQPAYIYLGKQIIECKLGMQKDSVPYAAGMYLLHPRSIVVGNFGSLAFGFNTILIPLSEVKTK
ncbi:heavy metal transporter [Salmonella enterica subsp. enterica serovar Newport]|nr:heavy metal transporter [Salmonella enterica subsp. enterica serovar Newport]